jgi:endonuclease/exonuclease/phosphatase family metal-dependent hydrolase
MTAIVFGLAAGLARTQSLPTPWADRDIGAVGLAGSATYANGTFTVYGAGADIWGTADSFHFVYQPLAGDGQIVARVASMANTGPYAKAGVMIRESLTAGSRHVMLDMKPAGGIEFMTRTSTGGSTTFIAGGTSRWLKLARTAGTFTASLSADGVAWTVIGSRSVSMATSVYVGLVVCSHDTKVLNTTLFDSVGLQAAPAPPPPPPVPTTSLNRPLRVVTWNIQHGDRDDDVRDPETQMDLLASLEADVIILQEMHTSGADYPTLYRQGLSQRTGVAWNGYYVAATGAACAGLEGNMVLTWLPVVSSSAARLVALPSAPCDSNGTRGVVRVELSVNSRQIQIFATHLVSDYPGYRSSQFSQLNAFASQFTGEKFVGGDFNTQPEESSFWSLLPGYADAWADIVYNGDTGYTHHSLANNPPGKRIDYWLHAGANLVPREVSVVQTRRSDHNPVVLDVEIR